MDICAVTYSADEVRAYMRTNVGTAFRTWNAPAVSTPVSLGAICLGYEGATNVGFTGLIDKAGIYNRTLTRTEIEALYQSALTPPVLSSTVYFNNLIGVKSFIADGKIITNLSGVVGLQR